MLEIERLSWFTARYAVRDDLGHSGTWVRRHFKETITGELDGQAYQFLRDGRRRFLLTHSGTVLATAQAGRRGRWSIAVGDSSYELRRRSSWRSEMELSAGRGVVGTVRKGKAARGKVVCDLPAELSPAAQTFIGFLVLTIWNRVAASSGAAGATAAGATV